MQKLKLFVTLVFVINNFIAPKKTPPQPTPKLNASKTTANDEPAFKTPEEIQQLDAEAGKLPLDLLPTAKSLKQKKKRWLKSLTKKQKIIICIVAALLLTGSCIGGYVLIIKKPAEKIIIEAKKTPPKPTTEPSKLTGITVPIETNKLPVTGVMIENSPDARPQAGIIDAGVVFEAVAEGGITRFLTLFQSNTLPAYLGPIRSVRPYYLDYLQGFDAAVAHVGGSPEALAQIRNEGIKDLDQFANGGAYDRIGNRYAPHNVYSSIARLVDLQSKKGWTSTYTGFPRKAEKPTTTPTAKAINFKISSFLYDVHYDYIATTNNYARSQGGKPHTDERSAAQLNPKVVIAVITPKSYANDGIHTAYQNIGTGKVFVFQDGVVTEGTWTKADKKSQISFTDSTGAVITLNPGQTWISLVNLATDVTFTP